MQLPIQLKDNIISREVYVEYNLRILATNRKKVFWRIAAGVFFVALMLHTYDYLQHRRSFPIELWVGGIIGVLAYFSIPVRLRTHLGKVYDKTPAIGTKTDFLLTSTQVEASNSFSHGETNWSAFIGAVPHQNWLMLHLHNRTFFALDTRRLVLPATAGDLEALLQQQNIPFGLEKVAQALRVNG